MVPSATSLPPLPPAAEASTAIELSAIEPASKNNCAVPPLPAPPVEQLLSEEAGAAVSSAFSALTGTILTGQGRTLEDVVKDMMRPMIKGWLDENLPSLVERLVKAEIERVSRGPRG